MAEYSRYIGGEAGHRSFFGGGFSRTRILLIGFFIIGGMAGTILFRLPALVIALVGVLVSYLLTANTHNGSILERRTRRSRWASRHRLGTDKFVPYEVGAWDQLQAAVDSTKGRARATAQLEQAAMRSNPDGADGMGWLQYGSNQPGIAWHAPIGEPPYLSVAFSVAGQVNGIDSGGTVIRAAEAWGRFLASHAGPTSLARDVQTLTRVLPPDTARHQHWASVNVDEPDASWTPQERAVLREQTLSYDEALRRTSADAMIQRHSIILKWTLDAPFFDAAGKFGAGRDGWRALMNDEIVAAARALQEGRMGGVRVLTARQTAAMILHQQNPHMPVDAVRRVDPASFGLPSHDQFSAHVVDGYDPTVLASDDPESAAPAVQWWHRTAAIRAENVAVAQRGALWSLDLLIGRELKFVRTISFHMHLVPAGQAKVAARKDLVRDRAEAIADSKAGRLASDDTSMQTTASSRRSLDLAAGSHHHGVEWIGYVTISAQSREELAQASRQLADTCATGLGIDKLDWMDSYQAAASGTTWPIGRGLDRSTPSLATHIYGRLAGRSEKEAIS